MVTEAIPRVETTTVPPPVRWGKPRPWVVPAVLALVSFAAACVLFQVWQRPFGIPINYGHGDEMTDLAILRTFKEGHWWFTIPRLSAPFGLDFRDFPVGGENLQLFVLFLFTRVLSIGATYNLYLLLSYPLVAVAAYAALRQFPIQRGAAAVSAFLFAFLPYHQWRAQGHLLRTTYITPAIGVVAIMWFVTWRASLRKPSADATSAGAWRRDRLIVLSVAAVVIGSIDEQQATFTILLVLLVGLAVVLARRDFMPLLLACAFSAIIGAALLANNAGYLSSRFENGPNREAAARVISDQDRYGLRTAYLLLPITGHRIPALANLKSDAVAEIPPGEDSQALGFVFASMFLLGGLAALAAGLGVVRDRSGFLRQVARYGALQWTAVALGSAGGLSLIFTFRGFEVLRTWNRISVWIGFLSAVILGFGLTALARRLDRRRTTPVVMATVLGLVAVLGWLDSTPAAQPISDTAVWKSDAAFYHQVEAMMGKGAAIYQLPFSVFPESPPQASMPQFAQLGGMIVGGTLRFSSGAMRGRPSGEWSETLSVLPPEAGVGIAASSGFDGVVVDRRGYADRGAAIDKTLVAIGARSLLESPSRNEILYDLRPVRQALQKTGVSASDLTTPPVIIEPTTQVEPNGWSKSSRIGFDVDNPVHQTRHEIFVLQFDHADRDATTASLSYDGNGSTTTTIPLRQQVYLKLDVPPGHTKMVVSVSTPPVLQTNKTYVGLGAQMTRAIDPALIKLGCAALTLDGASSKICSES